MDAKRKTGAQADAGSSGASRTSRSSGDRKRRATSIPRTHILDTLSASRRLTRFTTAVRDAGLTDLLSGDGRSTVFAPSDQAFDKIGSADLNALFADQPRLLALVERHVVAGRVIAPTLERPMRIKSVDGRDLVLTADAKGYQLNESRVLRTNIRAENGVIHIIDEVLG